MNDTERATLQSTYSGLTFTYNQTVNGITIESGHVAVKYNGVTNIVEDTVSAVESFCNDVDGG